MKHHKVTLALILALALCSLCNLPAPAYAAHHPGATHTKTTQHAGCVKSKHHRAKKAPKKTQKKVQQQVPPTCDGCSGGVCPIHREKSGQ